MNDLHGARRSKPGAAWRLLFCLAVLVLLGIAVGWRTPERVRPPSPPPVAPPPSLVVEAPSSTPLVAAARAQVGKTVVYDPAYIALDYPGGDLPLERGVCTDVVIRALRAALRMDLQRLVHEDMRAAFSAYPKQWGLKKPDRNIDHRRVPNLECYFTRAGYALPVTEERAAYRPGDLVTCRVGRNLPHIMIVSDRLAPDGTPLVIHNIGRGAEEEDRLFAFPHTGHYRVE